jgi:FG-GAP-like repeat
MPASTRSCSPALLLVLTASLSLAATDARGQSQFVTVRFQGHVTSVVQSGGRLPAGVAVGDAITGFFVYDMTEPAETITPNFAVYTAAVCAGFTTGSITVTARTTAPTDLNYVNIRDNVDANGVPSDQFRMGLSQNKTTFLPANPLVQYDLINFAVYTNSSDPNVNPTVLTSDLMQVMPTVGWKHLYFDWTESSGGELNGGPYLEITADHGQPFQIRVEAGAPPACAVAAAAHRNFDGDQKADLVVFRPASGNWYVRTSSLQYSVAYSNVYQWGLPGDVPVSGDFDGDGKTDLTVWRPSSGTWYTRYSSLGYSLATFGQYQWGLPGDVPVSGDFDGDGKTDLTVWRPSSGIWYIRYSSLDYSLARSGQYQWGFPGDMPVSGDFDGDGKTDLVVFRPSIGGWFVRLSSAGYSINSFVYHQWGLPGDQPIALDFDGDGSDDLVVQRPETGEWFILFSSLDFSAANYGWAQWGLPGDLLAK